MTAPAIAYRATDGAGYESFLGRWTRRLAPLLVAFARPPDEGPALDLGCGTGNLALALAAARAGPVVAIDRSAAYVGFARRRPEASAVAFGVGDACRLPFADGGFAVTMAQLVLNFVADPVLAAVEMRRVTRPGGVGAAAVWDFGGGLVYQRLFWDTAATLDPDAQACRARLFAHALAHPSGLLDLWRQAGFSDPEIGSLTIRMAFARFDDYWDPLLAGQGPVGSYVAELAPALRAQIKTRVRLAYLAGAPDGPRSMTATAWAVRGQAG